MNFKLLSLAIAIFVGFVSSSSAQKPLKVFVLVGQSNMQGHAQIRTFEHIGMDPKTAPLLKKMQTEDGKPTVCDKVWISYLSTNGEKHGQLTAGFGANEDKIGPEFTFGIHMQEKLGEPILIIKTAWGGKSLHTDFRSPTAGPFEFSETQLEQFKKQKKDVVAIKSERAKATGHYYRLTVAHVKNVLSDIKKVNPDYDSKQGYDLAGLVWFQGWNDMVDRGVYPKRDKAGGYDDYSKAMTHFIRDIRRDLDAPKLPFVIGVLGVGGPVDKYLPSQKRYIPVHQNFRNAMAAPAEMEEFKDGVRAVRTEDFWDGELTLLRARESKVNQEFKKLKSAGEMNREKEKAIKEELRAKEFTESELKALKAGVSNAEYHYLGCAKIMAQIGVGFADALLDIGKPKE